MLTRFFWIETPYVENLDRLDNHQQRHATHHKSQTQQVQTNVGSACRWTPCPPSRG